jgi:hypothetical protein
MTRTRPLAAVLATAVAAAVLAGAPAPANADGVGLSDEAGDASGNGLDFTSVALENKAHAVVTEMSFVEDHRGKVIVGIYARGQGMVATVGSFHKREGDDRVVLFVGGEKTACDGLTSTWDRDAAELRLRLPAGCLLDGDYTDVRTWFLTEPLRDGADVDFAPDTRRGTTPWVARD